MRIAGVVRFSEEKLGSEVGRLDALGLGSRTRKGDFQGFLDGADDDSSQPASQQAAEAWALPSSVSVCDWQTGGTCCS